MADTKADLVAAALYDMMAWLTTREERLVLSSRDNAAPAADAVAEFIQLRGVQHGDEIPVADWQDQLIP